MALSLDDKLLGEKTDYYCSSSEDEGEENEDALDSREAKSTSGVKFTAESELSTQDYNGHCTNTGPKGVINDWRRFKQLEVEKREEQEQERLQLSKKLSTTCRTQADDQREAAKDQKFLEQIELEFEELEDEFLKEYRQRRIEEMRRAMENIPKFGTVYELSSGNFSEAIDNEHPSVSIIVHLYENHVAACQSMSRCLACLASQYITVKFCSLKASQANLSHKFSSSGVPALLVYKNKELIGNFVRLSDELGSEFYAGDVEGFLLEHGLLPDRAVTSAIVRSSNIQTNESDSDYDVD